VYEISATSGPNARLVHLAMNGVHGMAATADGEVYLLADVRGNATDPHLIKLVGLGPFASPRARRGPA
jgi:hypothetical protein